MTNYIIEISRLDGDDTKIILEADGTQRKFLFAVVAVDRKGAGIIDIGYRTVAEARAAWPDAIPPESVNLTPEASAATYTIEGGSDGT